MKDIESLVNLLPTIIERCEDGQNKVIGRLQIIRTWNEEGKAYAYDEIDRRAKVQTVEWIDDMLALLKEQKAAINQLNGCVNEFGKDVVPVVRCKDCIYYDQGDERHICNPGTGSCIIQGVYCVDNWFCAGGERR